MKNILISHPALFLLLAALGAAALCAGLILILLPLLRSRMLAQPNARSSHSTPTPQGGGLAVVISALVVTAAVLSSFGAQLSLDMLVLGAAILLLLAVGVWDDLSPINVPARLGLQLLAIALVLVSMPAEIRIVPALPLAAERVLLAIALLWFVNLLNFMDGLDWLSVCEIVPVTAALAFIGLHEEALPWEATVLAAALCGGLIGFAPFNKPVARLFLGDAGSLPIGLMLGWCLVRLAAEGYFVAAILLPLYYLADASTTLVRRSLAGKPILQSHREHFYQKATTNGFSVTQIVRNVFLLNVLLCGLAWITIRWDQPAVSLTALATGLSAAVFVLWRFNHLRG